MLRWHCCDNNPTSHGAAETTKDVANAGLLLDTLGRYRNEVNSYYLQHYLQVSSFLSLSLLLLFMYE